jgi:hypothetical protein
MITPLVSSPNNRPVKIIVDILFGEQETFIESHSSKGLRYKNNSKTLSLN